ncbi:MAG: hypothetical protein MJZ00_07285 [Paludibacteraceae bacterium]|nr:hypothetical protein [Paludibacteraceae bacterium]
MLHGGLPTAGTQIAPVALVIKAQDASSTKTEQYICHYSSGKIDAYPSLFDRFYTQIRDKKIYHSTRQFLSVPDGYKLRIGLAYIGSDLIPKWKTTVLNSITGISDVTCKNILSLLNLSSIDEEDCLYAEFDLLEASTEKMTDKVRFTYIEYGRAEEHDTMIFTNFFGYPETMTLKGFSDETIDMDAQLGWLNGMLSKYDTNNIIHCMAYTGDMGKEEYALFMDLIHSRSLLLAAENENSADKRIVIESLDAKRERHSELIQSAAIGYRYAERFERSVYMACNVNTRIFDSSFNPTFE